MKTIRKQTESSIIFQIKFTIQCMLKEYFYLKSDETQRIINKRNIRWIIMYTIGTTVIISAIFYCFKPHIYLLSIAIIIFLLLTMESILRLSQNIYISILKVLIIYTLLIFIILTVLYL